MRTRAGRSGAGGRREKLYTGGAFGRTSERGNASVASGRRDARATPREASRLEVSYAI